jgi:hypothetical protein
MSQVNMWGGAFILFMGTHFNVVLKGNEEKHM